MANVQSGESTTKPKGKPRSLSYPAFCANVRNLTDEDLRDPIVQGEFIKIAADMKFPKRIRELAAKLVAKK